MAFTVLFSKIVGPLLIVRALSVLIDRNHFVKMVDGLEEEITTVSFSLFVVGLFMTAVAILVTHSDTSSLAAILIHIIAWGGLAKSTLLILFPRVAVQKAKLLVQAGFLYVVLVVCFASGGIFTYFGYFAAAGS